MENNLNKDLMLSKHVDFIANYGKSHDAYVNLTTVLR